MGILIPMSQVVTFTANATNPRKINSINLPVDNAKVFVINNVFVQPFTGSTTAGNADSGVGEFLKTIAIRIPLRGGDAAKNVVEPLVNDPDGYCLIVSKKDRSDDGAYEIIGMQQALHGDITTLTRDESANGGMWSLSMTCTEHFAEVTLVGEDGTYSSARKEYEKLLSLVS